MVTIKITSKRQATFPVELCEDIGIGPGDELFLEHRLVDGQLVWVIHPGEHKLAWLGAFKKYAQNKSHQIDDIRRSIARGGKK